MGENIQAVIDSINHILNDTDLAATGEDVIRRLVSFGYEPTEEDAWMIAFTIKGTVSHILNMINHKKVPDGLHEVVVDMACGEVLSVKYRSGQLSAESINMDGLVQSVSQGDTTVTFATSGDSESGGSMERLLSLLIHGKEGDLLCYRKLRW